MSTATFVLVLMLMNNSGNAIQTTGPYFTKTDCEKAGTQFVKANNAAQFVCITAPRAP